jgi:sugar/nucleoside kinase (ribokinase family)
MKPAELKSDYFAGAAVVHIEGYLLFNRELLLASLKAAKAAGALVSLDLASYTVVEASKDILDELIRDYVDILIANEDEAAAYTGEKDEEKAFAILCKKAEISVMKLGKRGSRIHRNGEVVDIGIVGDGRAVDTTGAGDLWAAGFLYGVTHNYSLNDAGQLAAACGYEVCQVIGANIADDRWAHVKSTYIK